MCQGPILSLVRPLLAVTESRAEGRGPSVLAEWTLPTLRCPLPRNALLCRHLVHILGMAPTDLAAVLTVLQGHFEAPRSPHIIAASFMLF